VAHVVVVAGAAIRHEDGGASQGRIAAAHRARTRVGALELRTCDAAPVLAGLEPVADIAVGARRAVRQRRAGHALPVVAVLDAVAAVAVLAQRRGRQWIGDALPGQAGLLAVAEVPVAAAGAVELRDVLASADRVVTRVGGARIAVVAVRRRAAATD